MKFTIVGKKLLVVGALSLMSHVASAMSPPPGGGPGGGGTPPCWTPPCVPIDGGISILIAAGAFVGARKIYRGTKK